MDAYDIEQKQKEAAATAKEFKKQEGEREKLRAKEEKAKEKVILLSFRRMCMCGVSTTGSLQLNLFLTDTRTHRTVAYIYTDDTVPHSHRN